MWDRWDELGCRLISEGRVLASSKLHKSCRGFGDEKGPVALLRGSSQQLRSAEGGIGAAADCRPEG